MMFKTINHDFQNRQPWFKHGRSNHSILKSLNDRGKLNCFPFRSQCILRHATKTVKRAGAIRRDTSGSLYALRSPVFNRTE
jgi:hypothetical protein